VVMRDQASSNKVSLDRYDYIRSEQQKAQPPSNSILGINQAPLLPPIRPEAVSPTGVPPPLGDIAPPLPALTPSMPASGVAPTEPKAN